MPEISNNLAFNEEDYEEIWVVIMSTKGEYELSKNQARIVQEALARGERGAIVFNSFAIPIPYIAEFYRKSRFLKNTKQLPERATEAPYIPLSPEQMQKIREGIYKKLGKPMLKAK
jgi:hypothetical protein